MVNKYSERISYKIQKFSEKEISDFYLQYYEYRDKFLEKTLKEISNIAINRKNLTLEKKVSEINKKLKTILPHVKNINLPNCKLYLTLSDLAYLSKRSMPYLRGKIKNSSMTYFIGNDKTYFIPLEDAKDFLTKEKQLKTKQEYSQFWNLLKTVNKI